MNDKPYELAFPQHGDERGYLVAIEGGSDVPFEIKRIFYIYGSDEKVVRGRHANKNSQFVLINVAGSCKVRVCDTSGEERVYVLDHPRMGLYLPAKVWKDMYDFSHDSILLCLSSERCDPDEYIRDYDAFMRLCAEEKA